MWKRRADFFKEVTGMVERDFQRNLEARRQLLQGDHLRNCLTGKKYFPGFLEVLSLRRLRELTHQMHGAQPGRFSVIYSSGDVSRVQISALQADPVNQGALFQVASNFNALELCSASDRSQMENLENYIADTTQGPYASISAAPALIWRYYYPFVSEGGDPEAWRQHFDGRQLELLAGTPLQVRNGYVELPPGELPIVDPLDVAVCLHQDAEVTFGQVQGDRHFLLEHGPQIIDQVFTATLDLAGRKRHPQAEPVARALLRGAYEGTLRCAQLRNSKILYLTLIGGGVFANPPEWISETLLQLRDLIVDSGLDIRLNLFRLPGGRQPWLKHLQELVEHTEGAFKDLS